MDVTHYKSLLLSTMQTNHDPKASQVDRSKTRNSVDLLSTMQVKVYENASLVAIRDALVRNRVEHVVRERKPRGRIKLNVLKSCGHLSSCVW